MKSHKVINQAENLPTVRDYLNRAIKKFAKNNAFIIKNRKGKEVKYTNISYEKFGKEMKSLGTALINLGLENKRIAIIGKNCYEWVLAFTATLSGVGVSVPLDKGLQENEILMSIQRSKADAIIFEEEFTEIMDRIRKENNTNLKHFICMNSNKNKEHLYLYDLIKEGDKLLKNKDKKFEEHKINPE